MVQLHCLLAMHSLPQFADVPVLHRDVDGLWYAFLDYLRSPAGKDELAMQELQRRLSAVKERLSAQGGGPYLQGEDISAQDMCLAPRLHHILTALPYLKVYVSIASVIAKPCRWYHSWHCMSCGFCILFAEGSSYSTCSAGLPIPRWCCCAGKEKDAPERVYRNLEVSQTSMFWIW